MIIFKGGHFMTEGLKWTVNEVPKSDDKHLGTDVPKEM